MDTTFLNDTGTINGSDFHPSLINQSLGFTSAGYPMDPIAVQQAVGGAEAEHFSYSDELLKPLQFGYHMPVGLNHYTAVQNGNGVAFPESQQVTPQTSTGGSSFSEISPELSGIGAQDGTSNEVVAQQAVDHVLLQQQAVLQAYHGGDPAFEELIDGSFGNAAHFLGDVNGYPMGANGQSLPNPSYDEHHADQLVEHYFGSQDGVLYQNYAPPASSTGGTIVEPTFAPAYGPLQDSLLNAGGIGNDWMMTSNYLGLANAQQNSITSEASEGLSRVNQASESHPGNSLQAAITESPATVFSKGSKVKKRTSRKAKSTSTKAERKTPATRGKHGFTEDERRRLVEYMENHQKEHNLTREQLVQHIWAVGQDTKAFWEQATALVRPRTIEAVKRHCRRQFHPYEKRGHFTEEEKAELQEAVNKYGRSWVKIGKAINRHPDDARAGFRDFLKEGTDNKYGRWNEEDDRELGDAMAACEAEMRADYRTRTGQSDAGLPRNMFLNADIIASKLNFARKRIQVFYRIKKFKKEEAQTKESQSAVATVVGGNDQNQTAA